MLIKQEENVVRINIVGIGGGGTNAVDRMSESRIPMVQYISINTDDGAVKSSSADLKLQIGLKATQGRGAGANPDMGRRSAQEDLSKIEKAIKDCDMLFIVSGMGGGTGTGAAPEVAKLAKELGILTVGVVTKPFYFEGKHRMRQAEAGIEKMSEYVDSIVVIPNDNLKYVSDSKLSFNNAMAIADDVLAQTVKNVVEVIQRTSLVNCDFADICSVIRNSGRMHTTTGVASGVDCVDSVISQLMNSKLLGTSVEGADSALIYITAPNNVKLEEIEKITNIVAERISEDGNIIFGVDLDDAMEDQIKAVLIATSKSFAD